MNKRLTIRRTSIGLGLFLFSLVLAGYASHPGFSVVAVLLMISGGTDFGRQCPLILSARHLYVRLKNGTKYKPHEL